MRFFAWRRFVIRKFFPVFKFVNVLNNSKWKLLLLLAVPIVSHAEPPFGFIPCSDEQKIHARRSQELQRLYNEDQADYRKEISEHPGRPLDLKRAEEMSVNDLKRRKRVGEILGEGCLQTAEDYAAAAIIYQHGNAPDHYFQAIVFSSKAVALGNTQEKGVVAEAVDRYLVKTGNKQLFGTELEQVSGKTVFASIRSKIVSLIR